MIWRILEALPHVEMTIPTYFILCGVSIFIGVFALRGNPTRGA